MPNTASHASNKQILQKNLKPVKIAVIGTGNVGATTAYTLLLSGLAADIVLIDVNKKKAEGEAMDLSHAAPLSHEAHIWNGDYKDCSGADIVIITAGINQKPGQTRMDLVKTNAKIFQDIIPQVVANAPETILLIATNPVDVLTHVSYKLSGFPANRVIGSGTIIDTARFRYLLAKHYGIDPDSVDAFIIGEHGDSELAAWSLASIAGMRLADYCKQSNQQYDHAAMEEAFHKTKSAAYDIIQRKGYTDFGVAAGLVRIVEAILRDEDTFLTVSIVDHYAGVDDVSLSIPTKLNRTGAHHIVRLLLSPEELKEIQNSAKSIKSVIESLNMK